MVSQKILLVDDDVNLLAAFRRQFRNRFDITFAESGEEALETLERAEEPFAAIICDMAMPGMNGIETLAAARKRSPNTVRIMLTGNADQQTAIAAINEGAIFRFYTKPCSVDELTEGMKAALEQYRLLTAEKELLNKTLAGSVQALTDVLSAIDPQAFGQALWLRETMRSLLRFMNTRQNSWEAEIAAMLSQVGWVCIPASLVEKYRRDEPLSPAESDIILKMPDTGAHLIRHIPRLEGVATIIRYQNKGYDGLGYPDDDVSGEDIPLTSRILKILLDGLKEASYTHIYPNERDFAALARKGGLYDPKLLSTVRALFEERTLHRGDIVEETRELPVSLLVPGQLLLSDIRTIEGNLILAKGYVLTESQIAKVSNVARMREIKEPVRVLVRHSVQKSATVSR